MRGSLSVLEVVLVPLETVRIRELWTPMWRFELVAKSLKSC